uniref:Uncharacterized protein n=1 Tax=Rhizophora mucronata TaxID=61149 RepID=A0A2P2LU39_RHIMU
MWSLYSSKC